MGNMMMMMSSLHINTDSNGTHTVEVDCLNQAVGNITYQPYHMSICKQQYVSGRVPNNSCLVCVTEPQRLHQHHMYTLHPLAQTPATTASNPCPTGPVTLAKRIGRLQAQEH
jgi:hypothetical protein